MVGYQGELARPVSQRHSASLFSATQTGAARAPARWAIEVSQVTMRSSEAIAAAVSTNASGPASKSAPSVSTRIAGGRSESCSSPTPFCREMSLTPATSASGARASKRHRPGAIRLRIGVALPYNADLEAGGADAPSPHFAQTRLGCEIGNHGRNRVEPRAECVRKAADRDLGVEFISRPAANRRFARWPSKTEAGAASVDRRRSHRRRRRSSAANSERTGWYRRDHGR